MKINWKTKQIIKRILTPSMWLMLGEFTRSESYDARIRKEMEDGTLIPVMSESRVFTAIDSQGTEVWIANYPYSYGHDYASQNTHRIGETTMPLLRNYIRQKIDAGETISSLMWARWIVRYSHLSWVDYLNTMKEMNEI